jgi:SAM-dependent methyltransferase
MDFAISAKANACRRRGRQVNRSEAVLLEALAVDLATYAFEAEAESAYWWFSGRRRLFAREIGRLALLKSSPILDVGSSTGTNLRMLRDLGFCTVEALDASEEAIRYCRDKGLGMVRQGDVCAMPFSEASFELVLATDVIEHVDDDSQAIREIVRILRPGGYALITVPGFPSLWGLQDRVAHHKRRYQFRQLVELIIAGGLVVERAYHFNFLLFVPIWIARRLIDLFDVKLKSEGEINSPLTCRILSAIFTVDIALSPILHLPFGVSILVIARKVRSC